MKNIKKIFSLYFLVAYACTCFLVNLAEGSNANHQREILEGAIDALVNMPIELQSQSSMTLAINSSRLDEARELIKRFRRNIGRTLSTGDSLDTGYQLIQGVL